MAAATLYGGPNGKGFIGRADLGGFSGYTQFGKASFPGTDLTCTMPLFNGGLAGADPLAYIQHSVVDKTVVATYSADKNTVTFTRTENSSNAPFNYQFWFFGS